MGNKERRSPRRFPEGTTFTCVPVEDPFFLGGSEIILGRNGETFRVAISVPEPDMETVRKPKPTGQIAEDDPGATIYVQGRFDGDLNGEIEVSNVRVETKNFRTIPRSRDAQ